MAAGKKNLIIEQNATYKKRFLYVNAAKQPISLAGYTAKLQVRSIAGDLLVDMSTVNTKIVLNAVPGSIDLTLLQADTAAMTFNTGVYDLIIVAPDGTETRLLEGMASLDPGVSV